MNTFDAIILGFIQGISEFLPVSSSGHLVIFHKILLKENINSLAFDAILQLATTFALIIYFRKEILDIFWSFGEICGLFRNKVSINELNSKKVLIKSIILGTIPAIVFGLFLESKMETVFRSVTLVSIMLLLGSLLMFFAQYIAKQNSVLNTKKAILIGFFQSLSLIPGVSRSGSTISGGLISGLKMEDATKFSFLLSIPILFGSGVKKLIDVRGLLFSSFGLDLFVGSLTAFIVGFLSIHYFLKYLRNHSLNIFIIYRIFLAILLFLLF